MTQLQHLLWLLPVKSTRLCPCFWSLELTVNTRGFYSSTLNLEFLTFCVCPGLDRLLWAAILDCFALLGGTRYAVRALHRGKTRACCEPSYMILKYVYVSFTWYIKGRFIFRL